MKFVQIESVVGYAIGRDGLVIKFEMVDLDVMWFPLKFYLVDISMCVNAKWH